MAGICGYVPRWEDLNWANLELGAKFLTSPKPYLKIGESLFSWGSYVLPPVADKCAAASLAIKSAVAPLALIETISAGCKLRTYVIDVQTGEQEFEEIFANGVINVGGFAGNICKSVSWLSKMNLLFLTEAVAFRVGVVGAICMLAKSSIDLLVKTMTFLPNVMTGEDVTLEEGIKFIKAVIGTILAVLTLCAMYQATAVGTFLALLLGSCSNLLELV